GKFRGWVGGLGRVGLGLETPTNTMNEQLYFHSCCVVHGYHERFRSLENNNEDVSGYRTRSCLRRRGPGHADQQPAGIIGCDPGRWRLWVWLAPRTAWRMH